MNYLERVEFNSMPCTEFYRLDETAQELLELESITVYQGMGGRIGGIRT